MHKSTFRFDAPCLPYRICIATAIVVSLAWMPAQAIYVPVGNEFQVNTYTPYPQLAPKVDSSSDGDFVVVWQSQLNRDGSALAVFSQRYSSAGAQLGTEFLVNSFTINDQSRPSVGVAATAKTFVIAWSDMFHDQSPDGVFAQRYLSNGQRAGEEFQVTTYTTRDETFPAVGAQPNGGFLITWTSLFNAGNGRDGSAAGLFGQLFDGAGAMLGSEFQVNTFTLGDQNRSDIGVDANGAFVVVWESFGAPGNTQDGDVSAVIGRRFNSAGTPVGSEFLVNTFTVGEQDNPAVATESDGDFIVTWASDGQDGDFNGVFGQRFASSGLRVGTEFQVNVYTDDRQEQPDVGIEASGDFIIVWNGRGGAYDFEIEGRRFNSAGQPVGNQFLVNTHQASEQRSPRLARTGSFVVVWQSLAQDASSGEGIFAQLVVAATETPTFTPTSTPTQTPTITPTSTPSATPTETPTSTPTSTPTQTPTITPTSTPSATPTETPTATPTTTPSNTSTQTPTLTPTNTPAPPPPMLEMDLDVGSTGANGTGDPDLPDGCIVICSTGPNHIDDTDGDASGCEGDDVPRGSGGTDANGNFQSGGQPGIPLSPPPVNGELLCVADVCGDIDGNCELVTAPSPAPLVSGWGLALALAALSVTAMLGIARRRFGPS